MTDPPRYTGNVSLPDGMIPVKATAITVMLSAAGGGQLVPQLVVDADGGGCLIVLDRGTYASLTEGIAYFNGLSGDEMRAIARRLDDDEQEDQ